MMTNPMADVRGGDRMQACRPTDDHAEGMRAGASQGILGLPDPATHSPPTHPGPDDTPAAGWLATVGPPARGETWWHLNLWPIVGFGLMVGPWLLAIWLVGW